jgi:hypothetical protein
MKKKRKIIICRLSGGIGNQLFMYAACKSLAIRSDAELYIDSYSGFAGDASYKRVCVLSNFNIKCKYARKIHFPLMLKIIRRIRLYFNNFKKLENRGYIFQSGIAVDRNFLELKVNRDVTVEGYWQSEEYFSEVSDIISEEFKVAQNYIFSIEYLNSLALINGINCVAVHFRVFKDVRGNLSCDYYRDAINLIEKNIKNPIFFIFTNDIEFFDLHYSNLFISKTIWKIGNLPDIEVFHLISKFNFHVISNSTFSWWAAWLSNSKMVISPKFFKPDGEGTWGFEGLLPDRFIKI